MVKNVQLINFRNYKNRKIDLFPFTVIVGPNGAGKSNLIESIYLLSTTNSLRTNQNKDLIGFDQQFARIIGELPDQKKVELIVELKQDKAVKRAKIDEVPGSLSDLVGQFNAVFFGPQSIDLICSSPAYRRRYLNLILSQVDKQYLVYLVELKKILKQRNSLLFLIKQGMAKIEQLDFWDAKLLEINNYLVKKRLELVSCFNDQAKQYYNDISQGENNLQVRYFSTLTSKNKLESNRQKEVLAEKTLYGPHRDDVRFVLNNRSALRFSSRGEARTVILALKLIETEYLKKMTGKDPVLLFDDVFSELDKNRSKNIVKTIKKKQVIVSSTDFADIKGQFGNNCEIIDLGKNDRKN